LIAWPGIAAAAEDQYFDSGGVRIRYIEQGQGEPVVLIHGFGGSLDAGWLDPGIIGALSSRCRVVAFDMRGHGRSGKPHAPEAYGLPMVHDVTHLLDHLKIERAHVAGYSLGGRVTMRLLAEQPERFRTAVVGGAGWMDEQRLREWRTRMDELVQSLEQGKGVGPLIAALSPPGVVPAPERIETFNRLFLARNDALALAAAARGAKSLPPPESRLRASKVPVLAMAGDLDPNQAEVDDLKRILPGIETAVIPGANHLTAIRHPEFLARLRGFLDAHADQ
jgi:pimeloyl-ACP methyl ester carboxylesterase